MAGAAGRQPGDPGTAIHGSLVVSPLAEEPRAHETAARLAAHDRLPLSGMREGNPPPGPRRQSVGRHAGRRARARSRRRSSNGTARSSSRSIATARHVHRHAGHQPGVSQRLEGLFPGRDFEAVTDRLHNHGTSSIKYGRGAVLTIDLTNRCNMMCDPCFMDANQVGYVHELTMADIRQLLDDAITIKPRRQMSVQFSGGEPTISPHFLDAVRYHARSATSASRRRPTGSASRRTRSSPGTLARRGCASRTCSSTGSATRPTRIARWATCSTSS